MNAVDPADLPRSRCITGYDRDAVTEKASQAHTLYQAAAVVTMEKRQLGFTAAWR